MALLKSCYIKFRGSFLADTGINPFRSCTIAGAFMHVFCTAHMKENTIARIPTNGYRSRWDGSRTAKRSPVSDTSTRGLGLRCTSRLSNCVQTNIMSLAIINGAVPFLAVCTTVAPGVTKNRPSTPCSTRPWVTCIGDGKTERTRKDLWLHIIHHVVMLVGSDLQNRRIGHGSRG